LAARDELDIPLPAMAPSYRVNSRRREEMDPATRRLAVFAGIIGGSLLLLVGVWTFTGHRHTDVPVIEADSHPLKVKPANPGGLHVDGANDSILSGDAEGKSTVAPPPEAPALQALKSAEQTATPQPAVAPAPVGAATVGAATTPSATAADGVPAVVPAAPNQLTVRPELQPLPLLRPHIAIASPKPAPAIAAAVTHAPVARAAPTPAPATASVGGALVQLAALTSEELAMVEWQRLEKKYPDLLGGRHPVITRSEHAGKTYWRLRTSGFADVAQATSFCDHIKAKGGGCSIASF
jgi:SPOR domain